jgi:hypothetical protein
MQRYDSMFGNLYGSIGLLLAAFFLLALWALQCATHMVRRPAVARRQRVGAAAIGKPVRPT